ncbi:MAG: 50S ribosomal protein L20 [Holophagales bacterium]|jgi:large subunit ribosomal protein L20|nr:50S ribosomal protein L20 [Holophagales bacterium]
MTRVKRGFKRVQRRKRMLKFAKGFYGAKSRLYRSAKEAVDRALKYSYKGRKIRKRDFRSLWIVRINAACNLNGISYSRFMGGLKKAKVDLDRKVLADIAVLKPEAFAKLVAVAKG